MKITRSFSPPDLAAWRDWLEVNGATEKEVWLIYYKVATEKPCITYEESIEEALCFGWIDSIIQKIDEERYARKFNPRRPGSKWSLTNRRRVLKMIREDRMTPAGLARVDFPLDKPVAESPKKTLDIPDWITQSLITNPKALVSFNHLPPSHKKRYVGWICDAKREETRQRRLEEAIRLLEQNERLGMK